VGKDTRIAFRASDELKERLQRAAKKVKLSETALAEAAVEATVQYIEEHGGIWLPLRVIPAPQGVAGFPRAGEITTSAGAGGHSITSTASRVPADALPVLGEPVAKPRRGGLKGVATAKKPTQ
jgi:hypothetical protein